MVAKIALLLAHVLLLQAIVRADDVNVDGNLDVSGVADIHGNTLQLGSWAGLSTPAMGILYEDGTTGSILWRASRFTAEWRFQHETDGGPLFDAMAIDSDHRLILYGTDTGNTAKIFLDPDSTSSFGSSVSFLGTDNQMPNQTLNGLDSILTPRLGDARYYRSGVLLSGNQHHVFGASRSTAAWNVGSLTIQAPGALENSLNHGGGNLILSSGVATGNQRSFIEFKAGGSTVSSTQDNLPITRMKVSGLGAVGIGSGAFSGAYWDSFGGLDISYGGAPATLLLGAESNSTSRRSGYSKVMRIGMPAYLSSDMPIYVFTGTIQNDSNTLAIGTGGSGGVTSLNTINIYTASRATGAVGARRISIDSVGNIIFNESSAADTSFRVKGNTDPYLLVVRGSNDRLGIGTSTPEAKLHVTGTTRVDGETALNGNLSVSGTTAIVGATSIDGPLTVTGAMRIEPQGDILMGEFGQQP